MDLRFLLQNCIFGCDWPQTRCPDVEPDVRFEILFYLFFYPVPTYNLGLYEPKTVYFLLLSIYSFLHFFYLFKHRERDENIKSNG